MENLYVQMFGDFTIAHGDKMVSNTGNRTRKVWMLIAYLIYHRNRVVKQKELVDKIWGDTDGEGNPFGALKTLLHRARAELDNLWEGAGKSLIVCRGDGYCWNTDYLLNVDCDIFEKILSGEDERSLDEIIEALSLYKGDFMEKLSSELWIMPIASYYRNVYIECLNRYVPKMVEQNRGEVALRFCQIVTGIEKYNEELYQLYMSTCLACDKQKLAIEVYQKLSDRLRTELGVIPCEKTRALYHEAIKINNTHAISPEVLKEQLREASAETGALICEYDFFRILYHSMARSIMRSGIAVHIALISAVDKKGELSPSKLEKVMPKIEEVIRCSLRRGDSAAKCSVSQYVIMLPTANYENSCMVCERIIRSFYKNHSYNDATLRYVVCPIEPDDKENFQWIRKEPLDN